MKRLIRRWPAGVAIMAVVMLAAAAFAVPASADPKPPNPPKPSVPSSVQPSGPVLAGFGTWAQVYEFQTRLNTAAQRILAAGGAGNASIVAAPGNHELRVYWKGAVPASLRTLVKGFDVPVVFQAAQFTHRELVKEAQRLAANPPVIEAAPQADGSGLAVTVDSGLLPAAQTNLQATSQIPLAITGGARQHVLYNRQADVPLYWGGSIYGGVIGGCTNGFPLQVAGSANVYMISAGHCGSNGDSANISGPTIPTGTMTFKNACRDTLLINYPAGVSPSIYTGPSNSMTSAGVVGATADFVGNLVATGGGFSGEHVNIPVRAVDVFATIGGLPCASAGPFTRAAYSTATCAAEPGDSGGPVYSYFTNTTVLARGTITSGVTGTATCPGGVAGSNQVLYEPLVRPDGDGQVGALASYGVGILTCSWCLPPLVTVPDVQGEDVSGAGQVLAGVGLHIGQITSVTDYSCNDIGIVTGQTPGAGAQLYQGSSVDLYVGEMPPPPFQCP